MPFQLALASLRENPGLVKQQLQEWLGSQADRLHQSVGMIEIFTGKAGLSRQCERHRNLPSIRLGVQYEQDFSKARDRRLLLFLIAWARAKDGLDAIEFAQAYLQEALHAMRPRDFQKWTPTDCSGLVIDSMSLYDALTRHACSSALAMEKRLAIDYAIARACLRERNVQPYWTNNLQMVSGCLTKLRGSKETLFRLMQDCSYHVRPQSSAARKHPVQTTARTPDEGVLKRAACVWVYSQCWGSCTAYRNWLFCVKATPRRENVLSDNETDLWLLQLRTCCNPATVSACLALACAYSLRLPRAVMASSSRASKQSRSRDGPLSMEEKNACAHMLKGRGQPTAGAGLGHVGNDGPPIHQQGDQFTGQHVQRMESDDGGGRRSDCDIRVPEAYPLPRERIEQVLGGKGRAYIFECYHGDQDASGVQ